MTEDGLYEFLHAADISFPELETNFEFDAINIDSFKKEFYLDEVEVIKKEKELKTCPHCNMEI